MSDYPMLISNKLHSFRNFKNNKDTKFSGNAGYGGGFFAPGFHIRIF